MPGVHVKKREPGYQSERTERQQQRILDALTDGPMTSYQLGARLHMSRKTVHVHIERLMEKPNRRVYVSGFDLNRGRPKFIFDIGNKNHMTILKFQKKRMLDEIKRAGEPISAAQLAVRLGLALNTTNRYLCQLKKERKVYAAVWEWSNITLYGKFMVGKEENAPKPSRPKVTTAKRILVTPSIFAALGL